MRRCSRVHTLAGGGPASRCGSACRVPASGAPTAGKGAAPAAFALALSLLVAGGGARAQSAAEDDLAAGSGAPRTAAPLASLVAAPTAAFAPFTVADIVVEGNERIDVGTILTYLPVRAGDRFEPGVDDARAVRALYETGLFDDVSVLRRNGEVLVVRVSERPAQI